jgi:hypothetical protein
VISCRVLSRVVQFDSVRRPHMAELRDWVEGLRVAAHEARGEGNITLADALDQTRLEVYVSYVDEDYTSNKAKRLNSDVATR